jgi:hypothetical protein
LKANVAENDIVVFDFKRLIVCESNFFKIVGHLFVVVVEQKTKGKGNFAVDVCLRFAVDEDEWNEKFVAWFCAWCFFCFVVKEAGKKKEATLASFCISCFEFGKCDVLKNTIV